MLKLCRQHLQSVFNLCLLYLNHAKYLIFLNEYSNYKSVFKQRLQY